MATEGDRVDELVRRYQALAEQQTSLVATRVPRSVDRADLLSAAMFGLFQAARAWEPARGVTFEAFARHRIRGALLDELRGRDWASRRVRSLARSVAAAADELTAILGRHPTDQEIAARLGVSVEAIASNQRDLHLAALRSADSLPEDSVGPYADEADSPEAVLEQREELGYLHDAVELLPPRLRRVVVGYYVDERPMAALAAELGVTESRISQMRAEAVRVLRAVLTGALAPDRVDQVAVAQHVSERALAMADGLEGGRDPRARLGLRLAG